MTNQQIPKEKDHVLVVMEHCLDFYGVVISIDTEKNQCVVEGNNISEGAKTETRTVSFSSIEKLDERFVMQRLFNWRGWHPDLKTAVEVSTERQLAGEDQSRVLWDALKFMSGRAFNSHQKLLGYHAGAIHNATRSLVQEQMAEELPHIIRDMMALTVPAIKREPKNEISTELLPFYSLWLAIMLADKVKLQTMLSPETFSEFFKQGARDEN